jgi:hypothetical protein
VTLLDYAVVLPSGRVISDLSLDGAVRLSRHVRRDLEGAGGVAKVRKRLRTAHGQVLLVPIDAHFPDWRVSYDH